MKLLSNKILALLLLIVLVVLGGLYYVFVYTKNSKGQDYYRAIFSEDAYKTDLSLINNEDNLILQLGLGNIKVFHINNININLDTKQLRLLANYREFTQSNIDGASISPWNLLAQEEQERIVSVYGSKEAFFQQEQYFVFSLEGETEFNTNTNDKDLNIIVVPNSSFLQSSYFKSLQKEDTLNNLICVAEGTSSITLSSSTSIAHSCLNTKNVESKTSEVVEQAPVLDTLEAKEENL